MERWREQLYLEHSAKGTTWGKHKYIAIKNGRYIYPEDLKKKSTTSANSNSIAIPEGHVSKKYAAEDYLRVGKNVASTTKKGAKRVADAWNSIDPEKKKIAKNVASAIISPDITGFAKETNDLVKSEKKRKKKKKKYAWDRKPPIESALSHSAKGTTWEDHKYIKKEDGVYYYPDNYGNGRHLSDGSGDKKTEGSGGSSKLEDWEIKMHKHVDSIVKQYPELFSTSEKVAENIMSPGAMEAFKGTLKALTGMDSDKIPEAQLNQMRKKIADYYIHNGSSVDSSTGSNPTTHKVRIKSSGKSTGPAYNQGISRRETKSTKKSSKKTSDKSSLKELIKDLDAISLKSDVSRLNQINDGSELLKKKKYAYLEKR